MKTIYEIINEVDRERTNLLYNEYILKTGTEAYSNNNALVCMKSELLTKLRAIRKQIQEFNEAKYRLAVNRCFTVLFAITALIFSGLCRSDFQYFVGRDATAVIAAVFLTCIFGGIAFLLGTALFCNIIPFIFKWLMGEE